MFDLESSPSSVLDAYINKLIEDLGCEGVVIFVCGKKSGTLAALSMDEDSIRDAPEALEEIVKILKEKRIEIGRKLIDDVLDIPKQMGAPHEMFEAVKEELYEKLNRALNEAGIKKEKTNV